MLYQNSIQILYDIIGASITIGTAILVWFCIEKLKKFRKNQILNKNFQKLFKIFSRDRLQPYMGIEIADLIEEIGAKNILKVLKLSLNSIDLGFRLKGDKFQTIISFIEGRNGLTIYQDNNMFNYNEPETNLLIKERFIKYFEEQCKKEKIKL